MTWHTDSHGQAGTVPPFLSNQLSSGHVLDSGGDVIIHVWILLSILYPWRVSYSPSYHPRKVDEVSASFCSAAIRVGQAWHVHDRWRRTLVGLPTSGTNRFCCSLSSSWNVIRFCQCRPFCRIPPKVDSSRRFPAQTLEPKFGYPAKRHCTV